MAGPLRLVRTRENPPETVRRRTRDGRGAASSSEAGRLTSRRTCRLNLLHRDLLVEDDCFDQPFNVARKGPESGGRCFRTRLRDGQHPRAAGEHMLTLKWRERRKLKIELISIEVEVTGDFADAVSESVVRVNETGRVRVRDGCFVRWNAPRDHPAEAQESRQRFVQIHGLAA